MPITCNVALTNEARIKILVLWCLTGIAVTASADTVALWLFDEQQGLYPSCVLGDAANGDLPLVLGLGGQIVEGKFGRALEPKLQPDFDFPSRQLAINFGGARRKVESEEDTAPAHDFVYDPGDLSNICWENARFSALMTRGQAHLRQEVNFGSATRSKLNLGDFDWTVEFWYLPTQVISGKGVVFEIGTGPRGKNKQVTRLEIDATRQGFTFTNQPTRSEHFVKTDAEILKTESGAWHHVAFVYDAAQQQLNHYVDGKRHSIADKCTFASLPGGDEDYLSIGRDGLWNSPLPGRLDELRISDAMVYTSEFDVPGSYSRLFRTDFRPYRLTGSAPLLFDREHVEGDVVRLGTRKYLWLDDSLVEEAKDVEFRVNPPRLDGKVMEDRRLGSHLTVFDDGDGIIRLYGMGPRRCLVVLTSKDGVHFTEPDLGPEYHGARNVVIRDPVGLGTLFVDPNAPAEERIKYYSGFRGRGQYIYTSPDGFHFKRVETSALPFRGASQSIVFYDDQRQTYVGYHRSDMLRTAGGKSKRSFVLTETKDVMRPWPFKPLSFAAQIELAKREPLGSKIPYFVDNGPLTPPGFGIEYPHVFGPDESLDPVGTDIYVPKCVKYPWAPDAYLAFPIVYFHYHGDGPVERQTLGDPERKRGSGPLETQLAVSRDGLRWRRYPRPAYIGIGNHDGMDLHKTYIAHGVIRRGDELWQYYVGSEQYHSPWDKSGEGAIFRAVQRLDGFVSADTPYTGGTLVTRPLVFTGNRLVLNIDTGATGYAQIGLLDEAGEPIDGYRVDDCIYVNGDFIHKEIEWIAKGRDLTALAGQPVRLVFRMRGSKLYSLQFESR